MERTIRIGGQLRPVRLNARAIRLFAEHAPVDQANHLAEVFGKLFSGDLEALARGLLTWPSVLGRLVWAVIAGATRDGQVDYEEIEYELDLEAMQSAVGALRELLVEAFPDAFGEAGNAEAATNPSPDGSTPEPSGPSAVAASD